MMNKIIALTPGEPSGVGIELLYHVANKKRYDKIVIIGSKELIQKRLIDTFLSFYQNNKDNGKYSLDPRDIIYKDYVRNDTSLDDVGTLTVLDIPLLDTCHVGRLNKKNAQYVLNTLDRAIDGCMTHEFDALVTGPISKSVIAQNKINFTGHTEYLQEKTNTKRVVMMLGCDELNVALATTHLALKDIPSHLNFNLICDIVKIIHSDFKEKLGIENPKILIAGLNPHAGEDGHLGTEEIDYIIPCVSYLKQQGIDIEGPLPADTMFTRNNVKRADVFLAMYHDQGLPVLKYAGFDKGFNTTLGLPFIRTSVDHGTALDIAGQGIACPNSLFVAIDLAIKMAHKGKHNGSTTYAHEG